MNWLDGWTDRDRQTGNRCIRKLDVPIWTGWSQTKYTSVMDCIYSDRIEVYFINFAFLILHFSHLWRRSLQASLFVCTAVQRPDLCANLAHSDGIEAILQPLNSYLILSELHCLLDLLRKSVLLQQFYCEAGYRQSPFIFVDYRLFSAILQVFKLLANASVLVWVEHI